MKTKLLIAFNAVLGIAVITLFILYFHSHKSCCSKSSGASSVAIAAIPKGSIVYVNLDTLQKKFDMYADTKDLFVDKQKKMETELASKSQAYESSVRDYQDKAQKGLLLRSESEKIEKELMNQQQFLVNLQKSMSAQLMEEEQVLNRKIINTISEYLKEYNKDGKFQYIMSYAFGGNLLFVPDSLDITNDVLNGLNKQYEEEVKKNKK